MSKKLKDELVKGAAVAFAANCVGKATVFLGYVFLARWLGAEAFGVINIVIAVAGFLAIFSSVGLPLILLRFVAAYSSEDRWTDIRLLIRRCIKIALIISTIAMALAALVIVFVLDIRAEAETAMLIGLLLVPLLCLSAQRQQTLRALKHLIAFRLSENIVVNIALIFIGLALWQAGMSSAEAGISARVAADVIALVVGTLLLRRAMKPHTDKSNEPEPEIALRSFLAMSLPLMMSYFADRVIGLVDIMFLGMMTTPEETGMYAAATRIALVSSMGLNAINAIAAPLISASHRKGNVAAIKRLMLWSCLGSGLFGAAVCTGVALFHDFILSLFGEEFKQASQMLFILLLGQLTISVFGPVDFVLSMTGHQRQLSIAISIGAVSTLILCPLLIAQYGAIGAAIATLTAIIIWKLASFSAVWFCILSTPTREQPVANSPMQSS